VGRACGTHGRGEKSVQGFGGKAQRKETRYRWEDGIRMNLREIGWRGVEWIHLAQDRVMNPQFLAHGVSCCCYIKHKLNRFHHECVIVRTLYIKMKQQKFFSEIIVLEV
jgi:hypothetical protein